LEGPLWQLPYQVIVDWNVGLAGLGAVVGLWQLPYQVIVDWNLIMITSVVYRLWWQLPYQVIVDWNGKGAKSDRKRVICDNYLIRWLWIETLQILPSICAPWVTITLSGDCGLKPKKPCTGSAIFRDNYLIRWLWIETHLFLLILSPR